MIYFKENDKILSKKIFVPTNNIIIGDYLKKKDKDLIISKELASLTLEAPIFQKKKEFAFSFSEESLSVLSEILMSNLSNTIKQRVISEINLLKDLYATSVLLDNISFTTIDEFVIDDLKNIDFMCNQIHIESEASNLLNMIPVAENNSRILKLIKKM